jgi:hypothetical protein
MPAFPNILVLIIAKIGKGQEAKNPCSTSLNGYSYNRLCFPLSNLNHICYIISPMINYNALCVL